MKILKIFSDIINDYDILGQKNSKIGRVSELVTPEQSQDLLWPEGWNVLTALYVRMSGKRFLGPDKTNLAIIFTKQRT